MNLTQELMERLDYPVLYKSHESYMTLLNGKVEQLVVCDTYQFDDYADYEAAKFDEPHKAQVHKEQFPVDCQKAFEIGRRLAAVRL
jgi:hypothetical protein